MKFMKSLALIAVTLGSLSTFASTRSEDAFAKLKTLAGIWIVKAENETVKITYKLKAKDSVLVENFADMVTVYHLDGEALILTHYCDAGNQPRLRAINFNDPSSLRFDFLDITNAKPGVGHISGLTLKWNDADHISASWNYIDKAGVVKTENFEMVRERK